MAKSGLAWALGAFLVACGPSTVAVHPGQSCDGLNLEACQQQCGEGVPRACYRLGWFYEVGQEVPESPKKAVELYEKACEAGWGVACRALGNLYWYDEVVDRQPKKAVAFYKKACELGISGACPSEVMMAEAEGRAPRSGFSIDANVSVGAPDGPDAPSGPAAPDAPTPEAPSAPVPQPPSAPTPSLPGG